MLIERKAPAQNAAMAFSPSAPLDAGNFPGGLARHLAGRSAPLPQARPEFQEGCAKFLALESLRWNAAGATADAIWDGVDSAQAELLPALCETRLAPDSADLIARARCLAATQQGMEEGQLSPAGQHLLAALLRDLLGSDGSG